MISNPFRGRIRPGGKQRRRRGPLLYVVTFLTIAIAAIVVYPMVYALYTSALDWRIPMPAVFVGFENYLNAFRDRLLLNSAWITVRFVGYSLVAELLIGFFAAYALFKCPFAVQRVFQLILFLPVVLPPVVVGLVWRLLYSADNGLLNYFLGARHSWLGDPSLVFFSVVLVEVWHWTPLVTLVFLAGLNALPADLFDAASVDGAHEIGILRHIVIPLMEKVIWVVIAIRSIELIKVFDEIYVLTGGGPGRMTEVVSLYNYKLGFVFFEFGYAAAVSWILLIVTLVLVRRILMRMLRSR